MMNLEATFTMNSLQAEQAIKRVTLETDKLSKTGKDAERSIQGVNRSFDYASKGARGLNVSAEKAGIGFKSLVIGILDSKQPIMDLAQSMSYLTRAFKVGVAGTVGIVAVSEVIKGLTKENEKLNDITKSLNDTFKTFSKNMTTLSAEGAIAQANSLGDALDKAFEKMREPSFMERLGGGISDLFTGGAKKRAGQAIVQTAGAIETANAIAEQSLALEVQINSYEKINKFEAERMRINEKFRTLQQEAIKSGKSENYINLLKIRQGQELGKIQEKQNEENSQYRKTDKQIAEETQDFFDTIRQKNESYDRERTRRLEAIREETAKQVKQAEEKLALEKQQTAEKEAQLRLAKSQMAAETIQAQDRLAAQRSQERAEIGGGVLGASRSGVKALEVARKQRTEEVRKKDFKTQEKIIGEEAQRLTEEEAARGGSRVFTRADVRKRLAAQQAAGEMPTLGQRITGGMQGIEPAQLARSEQEGQQKGIPDLVAAIERLIAKVNEAPVLTK